MTLDQLQGAFRHREEVARYIHVAAGDLAKLARRYQMPILGHVLDMAELEAAEQIRRDRD